jgi:Uma2 family endonuclease
VSTSNPPPDLIIEIDLYHTSMNKFPIYAAMGVEEIWRYAHLRIAILRL